MAFEVTMPRLGWSMESGRVAEWMKKDGDRVQAGETLFTVEGDKAVQEVEALESGILRIPPDSPPPGQEMPVGTVLAYIVQPGEKMPFESEITETPASSPAPKTEAATPQQGVPGASQHTGRTRHGLPTVSPRARRVAQELGVDWTGLRGSGRTGRIVERDVRRAALARQPETQIKVSPVARRLAEEAGVDLAALAAQKPGARIQREDVEGAIAQRARAPVPPREQAVPITQIRRVIAQRMVESSQVTAAVTLTTEADATDLVALREQLKATLAPRDLIVPTYNDLITKLTGLALQEHPMLNAYWTPDEGDEIFIPDHVHIGVAVDTEASLLVPVIRDVPAKSVQQIAKEARALADKARAGQLTLDDLQGGTFTITNLGMYGIDAFTPILNQPQVAILGIGRIIEKPAVHAGQIAIRSMVSLSLTFDHRIVDGAPAAAFLHDVATRLGC